MIGILFTKLRSHDIRKKLTNQIKYKSPNATNHPHIF